jgi:hypothetical protein
MILAFSDAFCNTAVATILENETHSRQIGTAFPLAVLSAARVSDQRGLNLGDDPAALWVPIPAPVSIGHWLERVSANVELSRSKRETRRMTAYRIRSHEEHVALAFRVLKPSGIKHCNT